MRKQFSIFDWENPKATGILGPKSANFRAIISRFFRLFQTFLLRESSLIMGEKFASIRVIRREITISFFELLN
jgi:hypothetical protein